MQFLDKTLSNQHLQRVEETPEASTLPESSQQSEGNRNEAKPALARVQFDVHTPVFLKKVVCPSNLKFDSETSSGAEWSLSMVTPTTRLTVRESPPSFTSTTTTTTTTEEDEEREEYLTTDESVLELRNILNTGARDTSSKNSRRSSLKVHMQTKRNGRSVVRTLFPARSSGISNAVKSSDASPLAHHIQVCGNRSLVSNIRKKESSVRKEAAVIHLQQSTSSSQELFGFPACVVPTSPLTSPTAEEPLLNDDGGETMSFVGKTPRTPHNNYLLVHSTPLCADQSRSGKAFHSRCDKKPDKQDNLASPKASGMTLNAVHWEPSCRSATPEAALSCSSVVAETPCRNADISSRPESFSFSGGDDVLDVLFMSSSQLEYHFNLQDSRQHSAEAVGATSTEVQPSDDIHACPMTLEDRLPKVEEEKDDVMCAGGKKQVDCILYPSLKRLSHRRSRIRTRVSACVKKPSCSRNAVMGSSLPLCTTKRHVDESGNFRIGLVLGEPIAKRKCSDMEGEMDEEFVQKSSDEEGCEVEADCCRDGSSVKQGDCEEKNVPEETQEHAEGCEEEMAEEVNGDQGVVTGLEDLNDFEERDGYVSKIVSEVSASLRREYQSCVNDCDDKTNCAEDCTMNVESLDKHPKLSQPGTVEKLKPEHAQQVDFDSLRRDAYSKTEAKVSLDTVPLSPIPVVKMRRMRVPGLSFSAQKQLGNNASVQFPPSDQVGEVISFVPSAPIPASCASERGSFVGFMTAAGSSISISTAALDKAKKLVDTGFEDNITLEGGTPEGRVDISDPSFRMKADMLQGNVVSLKESASFGQNINPKYRTPNSSFTFSRATSVRNCPGGSATYPRLKGPPTKRQGTKGFRAPRMASDVSKEEERVSLSRILKGFGVSTTNGGPIRSGFSSGNGAKLTVSHSAVLKARDLFSEDGEGAIHVETNKNAAWKGRKGPPMPNDSMTGFQTANGKGILVSSKSLERADELVAEGSWKSRMHVAEQSTSESSACMATGFKTAGGKGISFSCNALKNAQEMIAGESQKASGLELPMEFGCAKMEALESSTCSATGFKTASGKKVSVSSNALKKAQGMFAEESQKVRGVELPLELACAKMGTLQSSSCTATGFKTAGGKEILISSNALKKAQEMIADDSQMTFGLEAQMELESVEKTATPEPSAYAATMFKSADGSAIAVSLESLRRMEIAGRAETEECVELSEPRQDILEHCSPCKHVTRDGDVSIDAKILSTNSAIGNEENTACGNEDSSSCYFSTQVVRQLLDFSSEEESLAEDNILNNNDQPCEMTNGHLRKVETMEDAAHDYVESNLPIVSPSRQQHETEGCNLSESVVALLGDSICPKVASLQPFCEPVSVPVPTMANSSVTPPSNSMAELADRCSPNSTTCLSISAPVDEEEDYCQSQKPNPVSLPTAFMTAGGRSGDIPSAALQDVTSSFLSLASPLHKVTECSSEDRLILAMELPSVLYQDHESDEDKDKHSQVCGGDRETHSASLAYPDLLTANGKKGEVGEEVIKEVKVTLGCITATFDSLQHQQSFTDPAANETSKLKSQESLGVNEVVLGATDRGTDSFQPATGRVDMSGKSVRTTTKLFLGEPSGQQLSPMGSFHTTSGMEVESEDSVRAKMELDESCDNEFWCFSGFQATDGKKVEISEESIRDAKTALGPNNERVSSFCGFQTAGGKKVEISEESIRDAKTALGEPSDESVSSFCGFQTAGGKKVEISEKSIRDAKIALGPNNERVSSFCGFQTAGGKKVEISEESIRAAKASSDPRQCSNLFPSLQTASGKHVDINKQSLQAARVALGGSGPSSNVQRTARSAILRSKKLNTDKDTINSKSAMGETSGSMAFSGLRTAGENEVDVSCRSLKPARSDVHASAFASSGVYCTTERSGDCTSHLSGLCDNEQMAPLLRGSMTSIPEATLCDRSLPGRVSLQPRLSLPPSNIHSLTSHPSQPSVPSNKYTSGCPTPYNRNVQLFNIPQQNSTLSSTPLHPQAGTFNHHRSSSHRSPFQTVPFKTKPLPRNCSSASPTFVSAHTSSPHSHPCQSIQHDRCSYTAPSKTNFNIPMKGKSMDSYTHPAIWNTPVGARQHRMSPPWWRSSTPTGTRRAESSVQHEKSEVALGGDSGSLPHHLHITLSQVYEMEDSQNHGDFDSRLQKEASRVVVGGVVNDSGYVSCEVSALKFPSPCQEELSLQSDPTLALRSTEDLADTLFAEVAMEDIEDTLESCSCDGGATSPSSITCIPSCGTSTTSSTPTSTATTYTPTTYTDTPTSTPTTYTDTPTASTYTPTYTTYTLTSTPTYTPSSTTYTPTSTTGTPTSPTYTPTSPTYTPTSPTYTPTSTTYTPTSTTSTPTYTTSTPTYTPSSTTSTTYTPISTTYTPTSPTYTPTSTNYTLTSPTYTPTSTTSTPISTPISTTYTTYTTYTPSSTPLDNQEVKEATPSSRVFKTADIAASANNTCASSDKHVINPQQGSLLELRLEHRRSRVALRDAVCYKLPRRRCARELSALGVPDYAQDLTTDNAKDFRFPVECFSSSAVRNRCSVCVGDGASLALTCGSAGVNEFWVAFRTSPGVDPKLISYKWFVNHFKHLTIKLASMERMYPHLFAGRCLVPDWLMFQLKYRYDRGIDGAERSAIHRICEHDDLPSRRMVFYVSKIFSCNTPPLPILSCNTPPLPRARDESSLAAAELSCSRNAHHDETLVESKLKPPSIVLSDGWYDLPCVLDRPLRYMLGTGKIRVGTKLMVYGAELLGLTSPCHPLEVPITCCLRISANSTRRALWHARLGFQTHSFAFPLPLECLFADGGLVGCVNAVIARVYPMVYLEKKEGSKNVMRCVKVEEKEAARYAKEREKMVEEVCLRVRNEFENEVAQQDFPTSKRRRSRRLNTIQVKQLQDGKDIYNALMNAPDPQATQELLSDMQRVYLESYQLSVETERQNELQHRMKMAIQEAEDTIPPQREVIPLLRLRLVPTTVTTGSVVKCSNDLDCQLSIWRPHDHLQQIKEGTLMKVSNVTANPAKYHTSRLQLASSRSTRYEPLGSGSPPGQVHYIPRRILSISELSLLSASQVPYREFDTVGLVAHLSTTSCSPRHPDDSGCAMDRICLVDLSGILLVKVWGGVKSFGLEDVVSLGAVLCFSNLRHKGGGSSGSSNSHHPAPPWPTAHLTDITVVSQNPKDIKHKTALTRFKQHLPANNKALFLEKWAVEIRTYL